MRILMFNYEYPPVGGGGGVVHALIAEELAKRHRVCVITSAMDGLQSREERCGVEILRVPVAGRSNLAAASLASLLSYPITALPKAWRLLQREEFDIINSHFAIPTGFGSVPVARAARLPHVLSIHGGDIYDPSKKLSPHRVGVLRTAVDAVLRTSDAVVAQSTNTRDNTYRFYHYQGPIHIIPLGIRQPGYTRVGRADLGLPEDVFLGVTVGRLVKRKAIDELLRVLTAPGCDAAHLVVVGDGPELPALKQCAVDLAVSERVIFLGQVDEERKWQVLEAADVYLSTTMHEGFGLVYLEAMAAGLPVITYDHGGQVDFLRDSQTGYLVRSGQFDDFVSAVASAAAGRVELDAMGRHNREVFPQYRIEVCASAYEAFFRNIIDNGPCEAAAPSI
jgi:glycosyltransferase involved in cell wall biosynthesis